MGDCAPTVCWRMPPATAQTAKKSTRAKRARRARKLIGGTNLPAATGMLPDNQPCPMHHARLRHGQGKWRNLSESPVGAALATSIALICLTLGVTNEVACGEREYWGGSFVDGNGKCHLSHDETVAKVGQPRFHEEAGGGSRNPRSPEARDLGHPDLWRGATLSKRSHRWSCTAGAVPQGLKPSDFCGSCGTTKVVP